MLQSGPKQGVAVDVTHGNGGNARCAELLRRAAGRRVRGTAPSSVVRREVTPCERTDYATNARLRGLRGIGQHAPGLAAMARKAMGLSSRPPLLPELQAAIPCYAEVSRGPEAGCELRLGSKEGEPSRRGGKIAGIDLEGYIRNDLSNQCMSCQKTLKIFLSAACP